MKKQLMVLSFLIGFFSLWGMDRQNTDYKKMLEILKVPSVESMLADTSEKKEVLSLNLFKQFHQNVFEYFKEDQTEENRIAILTWIKKWRPLLVVSNDEEAFNFIVTSLNNPDEAIENLDQAALYFFLIYKKHLETHPERLCSVSLAYFHTNLIDNQYYQGMLQGMLILLGGLADLILSDPVVEGAPKIEKWSQLISITYEYIERYKDISKNKQLFTRHYESIQAICANVNKALQERRQTKKSENVLSVPIAPESPENKQVQQPDVSQELPIVETPVLLPKKSTDTEVKRGQAVVIPEQITETSRGIEPIEANPEPTIWDKLIDGWNRFLNMLKVMGGV